MELTGYLAEARDLFQPYGGGGIGLYYYGPRKEGSLRLEGEYPDYYWVNEDVSLLPDIALLPHLFGGIRLNFDVLYLDFEYVYTCGLFRRYADTEQSLFKIELGIPLAQEKNKVRR